MDEIPYMEANLDILYNELSKTSRNTVEHMLIQREIDLQILKINAIMLPLIGFSPEWIKILLYDTNPAN